MAAPVGNLLRTLQDCIAREPDHLNYVHLQQIMKAFDQALPFLHDAERRDDVEKEPKIRVWVSRVSALAVEVEDMIASYDFHIMNKSTGSLFSKMLYSYFAINNDNSVFAKIRKYLSTGDHQFSNSRITGFHSHRVHNLSLERSPSGSADPERSCTTVSAATGWPKNLLGPDLLELLGRFAEKVTREIKILIRECLDLKLIRNTVVPDHYFGDPVPNILESEMVGRHKEVKDLENMLMIEKDMIDRDPIMVIVTGVAGIGKTTLAKAVYERWRRRFDCYAWVFVSTAEILLRDILKGVLRSISVMVPSNLNSMDDASLKEMARKHLAGKSFLLVLDDVTTQDVGEEVKGALPKECRVKILVTSRMHFVPFCQEVLNLTRLSSQAAFILLQKRACLEQNGTSTLWMSVRSEALDILNTCKGNPLAIVTIGGLLSTKQRRETKQWAKVRDMLAEAHFIPLCYVDMHPVLKSCFLYAASFPLHVEIPCRRLKRLWLAEGFWQEGTAMTMEETVKLHLNELIQRNMIQVDRVGIDGQVETCRFLKPMREFALKRSEQDRFSTFHDSTEQTTLLERTRHLFLNVNTSGSRNIASTEMEKLNISGMRSLVAFKGNNHQSLLLALALKSSFNLLRVLELRWLPGDNLPEEVGQLGLLRYLGLRGTRLKRLPKSLKKLQRLQTLDIRDTFIGELPAGLEGLKMLGYLLLAGSFGEKVVNLDAEIEIFNNLKTLAGVKLTERIAKGLNHLPQLQKLSVGEVKSVIAADLFNSINHMKLLRSLTIKCAREEDVHHGPGGALDNLEKLRIGGSVKNLLGWVAEMYSLKYLYLWDCMLMKDPLSALQHLPSLLLLSLCNAYDGSEMKLRSRGFQKLKKLSILRCKGLEKWTEIEDGAMRKLEMLTIAYCPKLSMLPKGLEKLTSLQVLQVSDMPENFIHEARKLQSVSSAKFSILVPETTQLSSLVNATPATKMLPMPNPAHRTIKIRAANKHLPHRPSLKRDGEGKTIS